MTDITGAQAPSREGEKGWSASVLLRAAIAVGLGCVIVYGAGFAPGILHGHSHDSRHTLGFPCH